jgi:ABC-type dipeptide/oligopeptide/nickel transport system ATPase component
MSRLILEIKDLKTRFSTKKGLVPAVDGVNIKLYKGETHGLVGESGCGKSVTALSVLGLVPKPHGHITGGEILFNEEDLTKASKSRMSRIRGNDISMIFQEPMTSLNPVYTVGFQIEEVLKKHRNMKKAEARQEAVKVQPGGNSGPRKPSGRLPPPDVRRHAPKGDDRHGAQLSSPGDDRRRTHHGP